MQYTRNNFPLRRFFFWSFVALLSCIVCCCCYCRRFLSVIFFIFFSYFVVCFFRFDSHFPPCTNHKISLIVIAVESRFGRAEEEEEEKKTKRIYVRFYFIQYDKHTYDARINNIKSLFLLTQGEPWQIKLSKMN